MADFRDISRPRFLYAVSYDGMSLIWATSISYRFDVCFMLLQLRNVMQMFCSIIVEIIAMYTKTTSDNYLCRSSTCIRSRRFRIRRPVTKVRIPGGRQRRPISARRHRVRPARSRLPPGFPSARMRCAKAGAALIRTNRFRDSGGARRPGTATAREAGPAHRFHGIACRDAAGVRMPAAQGRPRPEKALGSLGKVASRRVPRATASSASESREATRSFTIPGHATRGRRFVACQAPGRWRRSWPAAGSRAWLSGWGVCAAIAFRSRRGLDPGRRSLGSLLRCARRNRAMPRSGRHGGSGCLAAHLFRTPVDNEKGPAEGRALRSVEHGVRRRAWSPAPIERIRSRAGRGSGPAKPSQPWWWQPHHRR